MRPTSAAVFVPIFLAGTSRTIGAQCVGDVRGELTGLATISDSIIALAFRSTNSVAATTTSSTATSSTSSMAGSSVATKPGVDTLITVERVRKALFEETPFLVGLSRAGTAAPCLLDRRDVFRSAVRGALPEGDTAHVNVSQVRNALRDGEAAAFATRYSPTDRIAVLFGLGMSLIQPNDARQFKVVTRRGPGADTSSRQYIVEASNSRSFPVATTGLAVRFRDPLPSKPRPTARRPATLRTLRAVVVENLAWLYERAKPTTVFGSVQFGGSEEGAVSGTALGLGWRVVGDVHLLAGFSLTRLSTLRKDLLRQFENDTTGVLPLPSGESESSILGTHSEQALLVAFAVPLSLRGVFGGGR